MQIWYIMIVLNWIALQCAWQFEEGWLLLAFCLAASFFQVPSMQLCFYLKGESTGSIGVQVNTCTAMKFVEISYIQWHYLYVNTFLFLYKVILSRIILKEALLI